MEKHNQNEQGEFERELQQYLVKYPNEQKIDLTIDTLRQYVPHKKNNSVMIKERLFTLMKRTTTEITMIRKTYWLISAILFILGYIIINGTDYDPLLILIVFAPIPFTFGLIEVFRGRDSGLLEMEMACKHSAYEIMLARLLVIGIYNITFNTILTVSVVPMIDSISMWRMLLLWFTPFIIFAAISLWLSMKFRGAVFISFIGSMWLLISILFISRPSWINIMIHMNFIVYLLLIAIGMILFTLQIKQLIIKYSSFEGVDAVEVSY